MTAVVLSQVHPTVGRRNSYRERWALVDGRVYKVSTDCLNGVWTVEDDVEAMGGAEQLAYVTSDEYFVQIVFTLAEARDAIAAKAAERAS